METRSLHIGAGAGPKIETVTKKENADSIEKRNILQVAKAYFGKLSRITMKDLVSFFRLLATMINAGISIVKALKILSEQMKNPHMKEITLDIAREIESGMKFSEALGRHGKYFSSAQIGMVEAGEATGRLNETLLQISQEVEKSAALKSKVKGAMIYPVVVMTLMFVAGFAVMTFVMPNIKDMFENLGGTLPPITQALIDASDFMVSTTLGLPNALLMIIAIIGFIMAFLWWIKTKTGKFVWSQVVMQIPVFGGLTRKVALARFTRGLSTLMSSGISIIKALRITANSVDNPLYDKRINQIADDVKRGITMGENMKDDEHFFPAMLVGMISVAEQTAQVDDISGRLADFYEDEIDDMVKNLSSLMEPIIIVIMGLTVGFLVVAVMMPILQSSDLAFSAM